MSDSIVVASQALKELKMFLELHRDRFQQWASGDSFTSEVSKSIEILFSAASRDGDPQEQLRLLAFECLGCLGALDPDRLDLPTAGKQFMCKSGLSDESEAFSFALHLIRDLLVGTFRSTTDTKFQSYLAFAIQELLKFCDFTPDLISAASDSVNAVPLRSRFRWKLLPKHMMDTVGPLLGSRYELKPPPPRNLQHPIYPTLSTYREWLQQWSGHLITCVAGSRAVKIFRVFEAAVRNKDVTVANHILPHLVLNILLVGKAEDAGAIRDEVVAVLNDQLNPSATSTREKRLLCAQVRYSMIFQAWI
jgi:serine/threonine-protein kinase ATR